MKNVLTLLFVVFVSVLCKAQQTVLPLNTAFWDINENSYLKDFNNELPPYIGVYVASYQGKAIILYVTFETKKKAISTKDYYEDVLVIKYIVKDSNGNIIENTYNNPLTYENRRMVSMGTWPSQNKVFISYSGVECHIGNGKIILERISPTQLKWEYRPNSSAFYTGQCPNADQVKVNLPVTKELIFTKQ